MVGQSQGYHTINYLEDLEVMTEEAIDGLSQESTIVNQPYTETEFHYQTHWRDYNYACFPGGVVYYTELK